MFNLIIAAVSALLLSAAWLYYAPDGDSGADLGIHDTAMSIYQQGSTLANAYSTAISKGWYPASAMSPGPWPTAAAELAQALALSGTSQPQGYVSHDGTARRWILTNGIIDAGATGRDGEWHGQGFVHAVRLKLGAGDYDERVCTAYNAKALTQHTVPESNLTSSNIAVWPTGTLFGAVPGGAPFQGIGRIGAPEPKNMCVRTSDGYFVVLKAVHVQTPAEHAFRAFTNNPFLFVWAPSD